MIKENINITFTGGETSVEGEGQIIVPSQVMTATPQNEEVDLEKAPNVLIKLKDEAARGVRSLSSEYKKINAEFELGDKTYTMNISLIDSTQDYAVLQYCDGLTAEDVEHTFECNTSIIETHYDLASGDVKGMDTYFMYDGTPVNAEDISFGPLNYHTITVGEPTPEDIILTPKSSFPEMSTGEFTDTLTATYKGMTATVTVTLIVTAGGELIFNAEKYYTAYDISENVGSTRSEEIIATVNDEQIDAGSIDYDGLEHNEILIRSSKTYFNPSESVLDTPGVYTDDVTAGYEGATGSIQVITVAVDTAAQTGLTVDKPYYACSVNENTSDETVAHARILYNGTELDPIAVLNNISGTYYNQYWVWNGSSGDFMAQGMETFHGYDIVTITYNNETISCLLKIDIVGLETPEEHTLEFDSHNYDTSYDIYTGTKSQTRTNVLYDGASIHLTNDMFSGLVYNKMEPIASVGGIFKAKDIMPEVSAGQTYVDDVTVTYEGLTASCTVTLAVTDSAPE